MCKDRAVSDAATLRVERPRKSLWEHPPVSDAKQDYQAPRAWRGEGPDEGKWDSEGLFVRLREE